MTLVFLFLCAILLCGGPAAAQSPLTLEDKIQLGEIRDATTWAWQMARNGEEEILALEREDSELGYGVVGNSIQIGDVELSNQFRWIASQLIPETMSKRTPAQRNRK
jgi:hypothetical protein